MHLMLQIVVKYVSLTVAALFCLAASAQLPEVGSEDVLLDLKFDRDIGKDRAVGGYVCTPVGGVSWISAGHEGGALEFNGTNGYMVVSGPEFNINDEHSFMLEAWIRTESDKPGGIMAGDQDGSSDLCLVVGSDGIVRFETWDYGAGDSLYGKTRVNDGRWHHVAAVFEKGIGKKIYVDGMLENSDKARCIWGTTSSWRIGKHTSMNPFYFKGLIDGVRISLLRSAGNVVSGGKIVLGSRFEEILLGPLVEARSVGHLSGATLQERMACWELTAYLEQITGKFLPTLTVTNGIVERGMIAVGRLAVEGGIISQAELDKVKRDGYVVKVQRGCAGICGWRDLGTLYGTYAFLEHAGVHFYAPDCEVVPKQNRLRIDKYEVHRRPFYELRKAAYNVKLGYTPLHDLANPAAIGEIGGGWCHTIDYLVPYKCYHAEHPEYFAFQKDGRRIDNQLCLSNPGMRRIAKERLLYLMEREDDRIYFGVGQGDNEAWCQCYQCRSCDPDPSEDMNKNVGKRRMADRNLNFVNELARAAAKKDPDKRILTLAYVDTQRPPVKEAPEQNVRVMYCPYWPQTKCQSHGLDCERNKESFENFKGWLAKCPQNMYVFDYPSGCRRPYEPFGSFYAMKGKMDYYAAHGIGGVVFCGRPTDFGAMFDFVFSRLLWDPHADFEALIDEFMNAYYGAAAGPVRKYFNYLHEVIARRPLHQYCVEVQSELVTPVTPEYAARAYGWFTEAEAAARNDETLGRRVRSEKFCVLVSDLNEYNPVNDTLWGSREDFAGRLAEFVRIAKELNVVDLGRMDTDDKRTSVSDWLYRVARIKITNSPWYADPLIERFSADPPGVLAEENQKNAKDNQKEIQGGWLLGLDGFHGGKRKESYGHQCKPAPVIWINGKNTSRPAMWVSLNIDKLPAGKPFLVLDGLDDDKPGVVRVRISVNGREIFAGPNPFKENEWTTEALPIPDGILRIGENKIVFASMDDSKGKHQGWFMLSECKVIFR